MQTKIKVYKSTLWMKISILMYERKGWSVANIEYIKGNYKMGKTCCIGCGCMPLAFFYGRARDKHRVLFQKK